MSFILDALDRSRRERDARSVDPLLSPVADDPIAQAAGFPWVPLLLLALVFALGMIAWLWLFRAPVVEPGTETAVVAIPPRASPSSAPPEPVVSRPVLPSPAKPVADTVPGASDAQVSRLYSEARAASIGTGAAETGTDANENEVMRSESVEDGVAGLTPDVERSEGEMNKAVEAMVARAEAAMDNLGLAAHPAPMLDELSQSVRDDIPTLIYSQHDYRANAGNSSVLINRERRREGDSMSGVRVQEILPDSVVLDYRGTVFRLRALNSWVNL
ncbi:MAG: general secretion pathway protein GspB [Chromatocurvus sp.]